MKSLQIDKLELESSSLYLACNQENLGFDTTQVLPDLGKVIGQPRAFRALELGSQVDGPGYNTFVLGLPGSGKTTLSREYLQQKASAEPTPEDWCYVANFQEERRPKAIRLPAGKGAEFRADMDELLMKCNREIARAFESEEYHKERDRVLNELKKKQEAIFVSLQSLTEKNNFLIIRTPFGFALAPAVDGKPIPEEDLEKLSPDKREKLTNLQEKLGAEVEKALVRVRELERDTHQELAQLDERTILYVLEPLMGDIVERYADLDQVKNYLESVRDDIVANADRFRANKDTPPTDINSLITMRDWSRRYKVNLLIDNSEMSGAPVVVENQPSFANLLGRIEHEVTLGVTRTDFTMIQAGALHRANGGYLIIPARDLLLNPYAWEGLKRVLREGEIRVMELSTQLGLVSTVTLDPEPIPLDVKVVMVGTHLLYYLLRSHDEDFAKLFKVRAEFATSMERTPETEREYGLFVKSVVLENELPEFHVSAVARIIEHSSRLVSDQNRLSTRFGAIADLVREAAYYARERIGEKQENESDSGMVIEDQDVEQAIQESIYRHNLMEDRIQDLIADQKFMIDVEGAVVGQVNALSVIVLGDYEFGRPSRITATAYPGRKGVIDIERLAELGGPIHTKGVLILSGFLGGRYGVNRPLGLTASLTFEQSYEGVEGDSASAAELCALLSSIGELPLRQDRAITGSVNQHGVIQAIGGVNEKIEGFFESCKRRGLTGEQGVIIPTGNCNNLMLRKDVVAAVKEERFHIWGVESIDEIMFLLTGLQPGEVDDDGNYPEGSFNQLINARLGEFSESMKSQGRESDLEKKNTT